MSRVRKKVAFHTLGCKLNQAETDSIKQQFLTNGYEVVSFGNSADITVINTCTVTSIADAKSRQIIRKANRVSPTGQCVVVGCYAQTQPGELSQIDGVSMIVGTQDKFRILDWLHLIPQETDDKPKVIVSDISTEFSDGTFISDTSRTRAVLRVQEGCDYPCSYCIIPMARGKARSRSLHSAVEEAKWLVNAGHPEIVLSGVNLGEYCDSGKNRLIDLLLEMEKIQDLQRIRISSIEPNLLTDEIIQLISESAKICKHFHIPLQHASNNILGAMHRRYHSELYQEKIQKIIEKKQIFGLGADVIVGFPGETEKDFEMLCEFIEKVPFSYLHVFRFSRRKGTVAYRLKNQIDSQTKKYRAKKLSELARNKQMEFARQFIGKTLNVLFETSHGEKWIGHSEYYSRIVAQSNTNCSSQIRSVKITGVRENYDLTGDIIQSTQV